MPPKDDFGILDTPTSMALEYNPKIEDIKKWEYDFYMQGILEERKFTVNWFKNMLEYDAFKEDDGQAAISFIVDILNDSIEDLEERIGFKQIHWVKENSKDEEDSKENQNDKN